MVRHFAQIGVVLAALLAILVLPSESSAQRQRGFDVDHPTEESKAKEDLVIGETILPELALDVDMIRSQLMRTKRPVSRYSITNPSILELVQYGPTEFELIGNQPGQTVLTLWFDDPRAGIVLRYLVRVTPSQDTNDRAREEYGELEDRINELFPNSRIQLIPVVDKLIVRGQARDEAEVSQIMAVLRGYATDQNGYLQGPGSGNAVVAGGVPIAPNVGSDLQANQLISMLQVPGEKQVMLKVRIADLSRDALRSMGFDLEINSGNFSFSSLLGVAGTATAVLTTGEVDMLLGMVTSNSYSKMLAEPNLVTLSGRPAFFNSGGAFAVPTVVGVQGAAAVSTNFQSFGTSVSFTPTVSDKDRIRLQVQPTVRSVNNSNPVNGIPGVNTRTVSTTVDLREGQWIAIAGLISEVQAGSTARVPVLGDIPVVRTMFSRRTTDRAESELIIMVSPELIHPMEVEETPLILPGMEVTEPNDWDFFVHGYTEGPPWRHHRSTVWPLHRERVWEAKIDALREAKRQLHYQKHEAFYVHGPHGFTP